MSALGIWNNRYEGGPCYAACMETFTLYVSFYPATIPLFNIVGRAVITEPEELMILKEETKHPECAKDTPLSPCGPEPRSSSRLRISVSIVRCSPLLLRISTEPVWPESGGKDSEVIISKLNNIHDYQCESHHKNL
jgi:hypothetical protein